MNYMLNLCFFALNLLQKTYIYVKIIIVNYVRKRRYIMNKFIKAASAAMIITAMAAPVFAAPASNDTDNTVQTTKTTVTKTSEQSKFSDLSSKDYDWARPYINSMVEKGFISGYEDGTYRPDNDVTRLEALSLFARAMGSNDKANAEVLEIAHEKYDDIIKPYALSWGNDEIAYLMYKGALKKADLDTYLKDQEKNNPMKRYEAAIIITKALGGEEKALSELGVMLEYSDAREVPSNAIQYVGYATDTGIMSGMGDGSFSPKTSVKRSQMAVMLSRTADKANYTFRKMKISEVDSDTRTITAKEGSKEEEKFVYTNDTVMKNLGDDITANELPEGVDAIMVFSSDVLAAAEVISSQPDREVKGVFQNLASNSGKITVRILPDGEEDAQSFACADDISVTYDGTPATMRSFTKGDIITIKLVNGKIAEAIGETKTSSISGATVENINVEGDVTMTIAHSSEAYNGKTFIVSNDVQVRKNDVTVGLDSIYNGDKVTLTLEYGVITKISAKSSKRVVEGTIREVSISSQSTMKVKIDDKEETYQVPKDVEILINGDKGTLYDFRVGDIVKITLESEAITKIVATSTQESSGHVTGVVTAFNTSFGVISIKPDDSDSVVQVYAKDDTAKFIGADGASKKMSSIKVGQTVDVRGTVSNGVFVGKLVVIVSEE